jgi:hypothetical protein
MKSRFKMNPQQDNEAQRFETWISASCIDTSPVRTIQGVVGQRHGPPRADQTSELGTLILPIRSLSAENALS